MTNIPPGYVSVELLNHERRALREENTKLCLENAKLRAQLSEVNWLRQNAHDCYHRALPGEPTFTLLARDPLFYKYVSKWATDRAQAVACGDRPDTDMTKVDEALQLAVDGQDWRRQNNGKWRSR